MTGWRYYRKADHSKPTHLKLLELAEPKEGPLAPPNPYPSPCRRISSPPFGSSVVLTITEKK
jgi:hypothetical protein